MTERGTGVDQVEPVCAAHTVEHLRELLAEAVRERLVVEERLAAVERDRDEFLAALDGAMGHALRLERELSDALVAEQQETPLAFVLSTRLAESEANFWALAALVEWADRERRGEDDDRGAP